MNLQFDPLKHEFHVDGVRWPSVTQVLRDCRLVDDRFFDDYSRDRGTVVHEIVHLDVLGDLNESTIDPRLLGFWRAWNKAKLETGLRVDCSEIPVADPTFRFAGIVDAIGAVGRWPAIIDIKTGVRVRATGWQTAAYAIAASPLYAPPGCRRYGLYLASDGTYDLVPYDNPSDWRVFSAATIVWWAKHEAE